MNNILLRKKISELYAEKHGISVEDLGLLQKFQSISNSIKSQGSTTTLSQENTFTPVEAQRIRAALLKTGNKIALFSEKWLFNFRKRYNIKCRIITHVGKRLPEQEHERVSEFLKNLLFLRTIHNYPMELIINFDETPAYYDMIPHTTYEAAGVKQVNVKTANLHKKG